MDGIRDFNAWLNVVLVLWSTALTVIIWLRKPGADAGAAAVDSSPRRGFNCWQDCFICR